MRGAGRGGQARVFDHFRGLFRGVPGDAAAGPQPHPPPLAENAPTRYRARAASPLLARGRRRVSSGSRGRRGESARRHLPLQRQFQRRCGSTRSRSGELSGPNRASATVTRAGCHAAHCAPSHPPDACPRAAADLRLPEPAPRRHGPQALTPPARSRGLPARSAVTYRRHASTLVWSPASPPFPTPGSSTGWRLRGGEAGLHSASVQCLRRRRRRGPPRRRRNQ